MNAPIKIETIEPAANIANKITPIILTIKLRIKFLNISPLFNFLEKLKIPIIYATAPPKEIIPPIKGIKPPTIEPNNPKAHNFFSKLISMLSCNFLSIINLNLFKN
jgi:hypothetical protein